MKKLLLVAPNSVHTYKFAELISGYFDDVLLITHGHNTTSTLRTMEVDFSLRNPLNHIFSVRKIKKIINDYGPSLIHIHQANSFAYYTLKAARNSNAPKILTAWGSDILLSPGSGSLLKKMVRFNLLNATAFTSDSIFMSEEMKKLVPERKIDITIANFGIDVTKPTAIKENIIYSNRLHKKMYRIDKIIIAFNKFVKAQKESWKLIIAATGEETENLKKLTRDLALDDKVEFAGWLDSSKNSENYAKSKIFVSIPESDATSISLLEAMMNGCLPVLSDIPANREWATAGSNGVLVENTESDFFNKCLEMDLEKAKVINQSLASEFGSKETNRAKFISLYKQLLK